MPQPVCCLWTLSGHRAVGCYKRMGNFSALVSFPVMEHDVLEVPLGLDRSDVVEKSHHVTVILFWASYLCWSLVYTQEPGT